MDITFKLPHNVEIIPSIPSDVKIGDDLYKQSGQNEYKIEIASQLDIDPSNIFQFVTKVIGDNVEKDMVVAEKKAFIRKKKIKSPVKGIVERIDHKTGDLIISSSKSKSLQIVKSFFNGHISKYDSASDIVKVKIKEKSEVYEGGTITVNGGGETHYSKDDNFYTLSEESVKDKVVIIKNIQCHMEAKLDTLDAAGIVHAEGISALPIPSALLKTASDFDKIIKHTYRYVCFSAFDNKIIFYN